MASHYLTYDKTAYKFDASASLFADDGTLTRAMFRNKTDDVLFEVPCTASASSLPGLVRQKYMLVKQAREKKQTRQHHTTAQQEIDQLHLRVSELEEALASTKLESSELAAQVTTLEAQVAASHEWKMRREIDQLKQQREAERKERFVELEAERKEREALVSTFAVSLAQAESENDVASSVAAAARQLDLQLHAAAEAAGRKEDEARVAAEALAASFAAASIGNVGLDVAKAFVAQNVTSPAAIAGLSATQLKAAASPHLLLATAQQLLRWARAEATHQAEAAKARAEEPIRARFDPKLVEVLELDSGTFLEVGSVLLREGFSALVEMVGLEPQDLEECGLAPEVAKRLLTAAAAVEAGAAPPAMAPAVAPPTADPTAEGAKYEQQQQDEEQEEAEVEVEDDDDVDEKAQQATPARKPSEKALGDSTNRLQTPGSAAMDLFLVKFNANGERAARFE